MIPLRPEVYARRCEILAAFQGSSFLPRAERMNIAHRHGVGRDRISDDLSKLRAAGCLELRGARGCYHWVKPYAPVSSKKPAKSRTRRRKCLCCEAEFESAGNHNRLCTACRALGDGLSGYRIVG